MGRLRADISMSLDGFIRQYLEARLLDESQVHIVPILSATASASSRISTRRELN
jgi:hypothetical protein